MVMSVSVCLSVCVCLSANMSPEQHARSSKFLCMLPTVLLWRRSDMLCTSGFMDDVIFPHTPRLLDVDVTAQLQRSAPAALGLATKYVQ